MSRERLVQGLLLLVPVVLFLRWWWLAQVPFHEDEAIYAAWSLGMARGDWVAWQIPLDKPPLTFYPLAAVIALGARAEWWVRLPTLLWGVLALWAVGRVAVKMGRNATIARALVLASPLWWALWASAFTDMAALALGIIALDFWRGGQPYSENGTESAPQERWAGVFIAFSLLAKPTMMLWLPLFVLTGYRDGRRYRALVEGSGAVLLVAWAWDASRDVPSWWRLGADAYGTLGRSWSDGMLWLWLVVGAIGVPILLSIWLRRGDISLFFDSLSHRAWSFSAPRFPLSVPNALLVMLMLWIPLHFLLGFQPWERYLLPLVVVAALWLAPAIPVARLAYLPIVAAITLALFLVAPLHFAPQDGRWNGIREVGTIVAALPPDATVWYGVAGRPLAWYAADARATLAWAGVAWAEFPSCRAGYYAVAQQDEPVPQGMVVVAQVEDFALWQCQE